MSIDVHGDCSLYLNCVDTVFFVLYSVCMATWHIWVDPSIGTGSRFTHALHALVLKPVRAEFESMGFTVSPMPEQGRAALSVSHTSESAITLYLLKHGSDSIVIKRVV